MVTGMGVGPRMDRRRHRQVASGHGDAVRRLIGLEQTEHSAEDTTRTRSHGLLASESLALPSTLPQTVSQYKFFF